MKNHLVIIVLKMIGQDQELKNRIMWDYIDRQIDQRTEQRMLEIEQMDKTGISLDEQFALIEEYNNLWDRMNKK